MKVSVIIPVYNRKKELDRALKSLDVQEYKDFEVVVVDDGSCEEYHEMIDSYKNLEVKLIKLTHTGNIAYVRNEGFRYAIGEYIVVLDSDDYCYPTRIGYQAKYMDDNPLIDVLATWVDVIGYADKDNKKRLNDLYNAPYDKEKMILYNMNYGCCICHSSVMMRSSFLREIGGYDEDYNICEDYKLWMDAMAKGYNLVVLNKKLTHRMIHESSVTYSYEGKPEAIEKVVSIKLIYISIMHKNIKKIVMLGDSSRNSITIPLIKKYLPKVKEIKILNVYDSLPKDIYADYIFVSTFSSRERIFKYLDKMGKRIVDEYIYL